MLNLNSLANSIKALERSLNVAHTTMHNAGADLQEIMRAGVIQQFEVAYEQCWKFLQRWIRENRTPENADFPRTRKELFRMSAQYGLINDPLPWFEYGNARNLTSHTYDEKYAIALYDIADKFLQDAKNLLVQLRKHND